jgi:hypothetical protein
MLHRLLRMRKHNVICAKERTSLIFRIARSADRANKKSFASGLEAVWTLPAKAAVFKKS